MRQSGQGCLGDHQLSRADQAVLYAYPPLGAPAGVDCDRQQS
jgi:hypothetical protein